MLLLVLASFCRLPRGSRYLIILDSRPKDHVINSHYGFWDLVP